MNVDYSDGDEREARLDWMIEEFRKAQARRQAKPAETGLESRVETDKKVATERSVIDGHPVTGGHTR